MLTAKTPRKRSGYAPAIERLQVFRCKGCKGGAIHDKGRVRVAHTWDCQLNLAMHYRHPRLSSILEKYRNMPA